MKTIIQITLLTIILVGCKTSKNITTSPDNLKGIIVNYNARKTSKGSYKPDTIYTNGSFYVETVPTNAGSYAVTTLPYQESGLVTAYRDRAIVTGVIGVIFILFIVMLNVIPDKSKIV